MAGTVRRYKTKNSVMWMYVIELGKDANGNRKRKIKKGFKTKGEAHNAKTEVENEVIKGSYTEPSKMLYKDYLEKWLSNKQVKKRTLETYTWLVTKHIIPTLGYIELSKLNAMQIESLISSLNKENKLSDENIQKIYTLIKDSLNKAVKHELITKNVASNVNRPKVSKKNIEVWDELEIKQFLKIASKDRSHIVFHLALTTGMRQSEILGLQWRNIDLGNELIYINQQIERDTKNFTDLKTKTANRNIAIYKETIKELTKQKELIIKEKEKAGDIYEKTKLDLVAPTSVGTPYLHSNIRKIFNRLIKESGVKKIRFHDLRHTHATLLLKMNINPKIVQERLGHANVRITLDTYSHLLPNMQAETAQKLNKILFEE